MCTTPANEWSAGAVDCMAARACPDPAQRLSRLWAIPAGRAGWVGLGTQCQGGTPEPAAAAPQAPPRVTPALVLRALRRIGLPTLHAVTQPADKTLVNFATILYTRPRPFTRTVQLLGQRVDLHATPSRYTWHHGDGTTAATSTPGAPFPAKDITHTYTDADVTVAVSVDVTYTARFRVAGGPWQTIPDTVTIPGPATDLQIAEATAVLSGGHQ